MIILDIETTGLTDECGIYEIGAINLEDVSNVFFQNARIDEEDIIQKEALKINGKTELELRDIYVQSQEQLIKNYLDWVGVQQEKLFYGQNINWDISKIQSKSIKYGLFDTFNKIHSHRGFDLHTIAQEKYKAVYDKFLLNKNGTSAMSLGKILQFCGMKDNRKTHNSLEDCKLEGECISRLDYGKNWHPDYAKFKIPSYLKK